MMTGEHLHERIGLSTSFMPCNGESFLEAVDQAYDAGWKTIEIAPTPHIGLTGHPRLRCGVGFELDEISASERDRIVESVARFPLRTLHSAQADVNLASRNSGIRRESMRQCLQSAEFARPNDQGFVGVVRLADVAENLDLRMGFEHAGTWPGPEQMLEILEGIGSPRFGLHFDVGHAWLAPPVDPLAWVGLMADRLVMAHLHGTFYRPDRGFENHGPLAHDDCTDWAAVLDAFEKHAYAGPLVFEILTSSITDYLRHANRSREILLKINEERRAERREAPAGENATPMEDTGQELGDLIRRMKLLAFDFDGVFTDNRVHVNQEGIESVSCWRGDGEGFKMIRRLGIDMVIISTEKNPVVAARGRKVGIRCLQGVEDKAGALKGIAEESGLSMDEVAFVGNDTNDVPALRVAALPIAVGDAHPAAAAIAKYRTTARGGYGAVREVCDLFFGILSPEP